MMRLLVALTSFCVLCSCVVNEASRHPPAPRQASRRAAITTRELAAQIVRSNGKPVAHRDVTVFCGGKMTRVRTDAQGMLRVVTQHAVCVAQFAGEQHEMGRQRSTWRLRGHLRVYVRLHHLSGITSVILDSRIKTPAFIGIDRINVERGGWVTLNGRRLVAARKGVKHRLFGRGKHVGFFAASTTRAKKLGVQLATQQAYAALDAYVEGRVAAVSGSLRRSDGQDLRNFASARRKHQRGRLRAALLDYAKVLAQITTFEFSGQSPREDLERAARYFFLRIEDATRSLDPKLLQQAYNVFWPRKLRVQPQLPGAWRVVDKLRSLLRLPKLVKRSFKPVNLSRVCHESRATLAELKVAATHTKDRILAKSVQRMVGALLARGGTVCPWIAIDEVEALPSPSMRSPPSPSQVLAVPIRYGKVVRPLGALLSRRTVLWVAPCRRAGKLPRRELAKLSVDLKRAGVVAAVAAIDRCKTRDAALGTWASGPELGLALEIARPSVVIIAKNGRVLYRQRSSATAVEDVRRVLNDDPQVMALHKVVVRESRTAAAAAVKRLRRLART